MKQPWGGALCLLSLVVGLTALITTWGTQRVKPLELPPQSLSFVSSQGWQRETYTFLQNDGISTFCKLAEKGARVRRGHLSQGQWDSLLEMLPSDLSQRQQELATEPPGPAVAYEEGLATLAFHLESSTVVLSIHPYHLSKGELYQFFQALDDAVQSLPPVEAGERGLVLIPSMEGTPFQSPPDGLSETLLAASRTPWGWHPVPARVGMGLEPDSISSVDGRKYRVRFRTTLPPHPLIR